ncbi:TonB-dependent receptor [Marivirga lumbricoides]|uniref:TonB-dependent receptor n=1 Tax=Marivirga lumbricoides TaxID=1046115 RepID=A0A2T4DS51_9BACT|nr:TonB-dependent receptor [Marivirga lumbricoides]
MKSLYLFIFISCLAISSGLAQKGFLRGKVTDAETGEALIGATISIPGTGTGAVADFEGNYSLPLDPGTYTISFQFVSYQSKNVSEIQIAAGETNSLDVSLTSDVSSLSEVVVRAKAIRDSDAGLLIMQKKSAVVLDGMSSQTFKKIGDNNLSGAIKRVTGVSVQGGKYVYVRGLGDRYTRTTLNGMSIPGLDPERNDVQIDLFPTNVLENIVVYKTFSPELAADFTGGTVNIETKSFPEEKVTSLKVGVGYNPQMNLSSDYLSYNGGETDFIGIDDGTRDLPISDPQAGVPQTGSPELGPLTRSLNPEMAAMRKKSFINTNFSFNHGNQLDFSNYKIGYGVVLNYQNNYEYFDDIQYSLYFKDANRDINQLDAQFIREGELGRNNVLWSTLLTGAIKFSNHQVGVTFLGTQNGISEASQLLFVDKEETGQTAYQDVLTYSQRSLLSPTLYGKHKFNKVNLEWTNSFTKARVYDPDFRETLIAEVPRFVGGEPVEPDYSIAGGQGGRAGRFWRDLNEDNENFRIDASYSISEKNKIKIGGAGLLKWRKFETFSFNLNKSGVIENDPNFLLLPENIYSLDNRSGTYLQGNYEAANNYEARSQVFAAYAMNDISITDNIRAIYGLRAEKVNMFYTGENNFGTVVYDDEKTLDELNLLPSVNTVFSISENSNIRASYGRTLARPSFREKSIAEILDPISGIRFSGNIDLNQTNIDNFDVRYESFFDRNQMFSVSAFYKQFDGHIEQVRFEIEPTAVTWQNIGGSYVYGVELEVRKNLDFIVPGIALGTNVSLAKSSVNMKEVVVFEDGVTGENTTEYESRLSQARTDEHIEETRVMAGQSPYLINSFLNYSDEEGLTNINLSYNVQGESLSVVGVGNVPDVYAKPFHSLNLNASRSFGYKNRMQLSVGVDNILGDKKEEVWRNNDSPEEVFSVFDLGRNYSISFAFTF